MSFFERYLTLWVVLCIIAGIALGEIAPQVAERLDQLTITVNGAPVVSVPIALCLFFMMYPIMVKIDFGEVVRAGKAVRRMELAGSSSSTALRCLKCRCGEATSPAVSC